MQASIIRAGPEQGQSAPVYLLGDIVSSARPALDCLICHASSISHREGTVDYELYHKTIVEMEKKHVSAEYIQGWIGGFMGNPKREKQRVTEAYDTGFEDGVSKNTSNYKKWIES
jgi:hypothetical protein